MQLASVAVTWSLQAGAAAPFTPLREEQAQGLQPFGSRNWCLQLAFMAVTWCLQLQVKSALEAAAPVREERAQGLQPLEAVFKVSNLRPLLL